MVRHEFIPLLVALINSFPNHHQLKYLQYLSHSDVELDFFENIVHLQIHRRQRAFRHLTDSLEHNKANFFLLYVYIMCIYIHIFIYFYIFMYFIFFILKL